MDIRLGKEEKEQLESQHKTERDKRVADRIKSVLLLDENWSQVQIAQALRIRPETVYDHIMDYKASRKLKPENGGSDSQLNKAQASELISHLELFTYIKVRDICVYVKATYGAEYTVSGMTKWLHAHKFSYKQPKPTPAKADPVEQAKFAEYYEALKQETPAEEPIVFTDAVHPTMATKISGGWIRTGKDKTIATTASRTRMNVVGALNLKTMQVTTQAYDTIDSLSMSQYWIALKATYPEAPKIHVIADRGPYNTSAATKAAAEQHGVVLHYLPAYSPNLNPIERVWKIMNEYVRNNIFFTSVKEFRNAITDFFSKTWPSIAMSLVGRINDNFQKVQQVSSG